MLAIKVPVLSQLLTAIVIDFMWHSVNKGFCLRCHYEDAEHTPHKRSHVLAFTPLQERPYYWCYYAAGIMFSAMERCRPDVVVYNIRVGYNHLRFGRLEARMFPVHGHAVCDCLYVWQPRRPHNSSRTVRLKDTLVDPTRCVGSRAPLVTPLLRIVTTLATLEVSLPLKIMFLIIKRYQVRVKDTL